MFVWGGEQVWSVSFPLPTCMFQATPPLPPSFLTPTPPPILSHSLPSPHPSSLPPLPHPFSLPPLPLLSHRWCHWLKTSSRDWTVTMTRASVRRSSSLTTPRRWDTCTPRTRYCTDSTCTCGPLYKMFIPCMFYCTGSFIFSFPIKSTSVLSLFISMSHDCHMMHVTFPSLCLPLLNL